MSYFTSWSTPVFLQIAIHPFSNAIFTLQPVSLDMIDGFTTIVGTVQMHIYHWMLLLSGLTHIGHHGLDRMFCDTLAFAKRHTSDHVPSLPPHPTVIFLPSSTWQWSAHPVLPRQFIFLDHLATRTDESQPAHTYGTKEKLTVQRERRTEIQHHATEKACLHGLII